MELFRDILNFFAKNPGFVFWVLCLLIVVPVDVILLLGLRATKKTGKTVIIKLREGDRVFFEINSFSTAEIKAVSVDAFTLVNGDAIFLSELSATVHQYLGKINLNNILFLRTGFEEVDIQIDFLEETSVAVHKSLIRKTLRVMMALFVTGILVLGFLGIHASLTT